MKGPTVRRPRSSQKESGFDATRRVQSHSRTSKAARSSPKSGAKSGKASSRTSSPRQRRLPFEESASLFSRFHIENHKNRMVQLGIAVLVILLAGGLGMAVYTVANGMRLFALKSVIVHRTQQPERNIVNDEDIRRIVADLAPEGVIKADLGKIREALAAIELIEGVEVNRLLPDTIRVSFREREPFALANRSDGALVCVDRSGVMFGTGKLFYKRPRPAPISGLREGGEGAAVFNAQCIATYQKMMVDVDRVTPRLSEMIEEVHFDESGQIHVNLRDSQITVNLGTADYRNRLNAALDILDAVKRRDLEALILMHVVDGERLFSAVRIRYLNTTDPRRIVVGF